MEGYVMAVLETINIGSVANDGTGDGLRSAGQKINANFTTINNELGTLDTTVAGKASQAAVNAKLANIVEDTTPQLGGSLDGQGNSVINSPVALNTQTGTTYTLAASDASKVITLDNASSITLIVPTNASVAFPLGTVISFIQKGAGVISVGGAGVTINNRQTFSDTAGQWAMGSLIKIDIDTWLLSGDLA
jgi:hypothetical protein